jgi:SAM-dependent methyltransferase
MPDGPDLSSLARNARTQELRPSRPRPHAWWEVFFDDDYLRTVRPPTREQIARQCDFIERRLGLKPGATLLDVGCGLGLHVLELASRGYLGVGLDLSLPMLSRASEEAQSRSLRVNFLHSDMREMSFEGAFDAVLCLGTSLGYFDEDTNRRILERLYRALKPGGALLLDLVNRDHVIRSQPNLIWFEGDGCVCMEESEFNFFTSRLHIKRTVILDSGRQTENEYSLRLYSLHELGQLLNGIGFRVKEVSGRDALPGVFFGQESPNLVIVAERRPGTPDPSNPGGDERAAG